jgi:DNA-binding XRE family transcriptional regulator
MMGPHRRVEAVETNAGLGAELVHVAVSALLALGKSLTTGHCPGRLRQLHDLTKLFQTMELPMPSIAKRDTFSESVETEVARDHSIVRAARENRGYSLEELSLACGLATNEITDIENGKNADPLKLRRIASALRLPASALINAAVPTQPADNRSNS